jgi:deoxycytidylate deaminase
MANSSKLHSTFEKLATKAIRSELLHKHVAGFTGSGHRQTGFMPGYNHYSHCRHSVNDSTIHAEIDVIDRYLWYQQTRHANNAKVRRKLRKLNLLIARLSTNRNVNGDSTFKDSAPCLHCLESLRTCGITKVIYSSDSGKPQCKKAKPIT